MSLLISILTTLLSFVLALFVYSKNSRKAVNVYLALLIVFLGLYPIFNELALTSSSPEDAFLWSKFILLSAIPAGPLFFFFVSVFPDGGFVFSKKIQTGIIAWIILNLVFAFSGLIFSEVSIVDSAPQIKPGPAIPLFAFLQLITIFSAVFILIRKTLNATGIQSLQLRYIAWGIGINFGLMLITTVLIPILFNYGGLIVLSPLFLLGASSTITVSILRHRLLDIRAIVARSVAYLLLMATLGGVYGLAVFGLTELVFRENNTLGGSQLGIYILLAVAVAFSFQPIKKFFDRVSNKLFFRDSYDSQEVLDKLSTLFATEIDLNHIVISTTRLIDSRIKPTYVRVIVFDEEQNIFYDYRTQNAPPIKISQLQIQKFGGQIVVLDEADQRSDNLLLKKFRSEILLKLETNESFVGAMLLGPKQTGGIYSKQDIELLRILERELSVSIQNARYFEEIQQFNVTLQKKIEQATRRLELSNQKLKELDEAKDEFISMASHQLRTPLTSIKGYVSMVLEGDAGKVSKQQKKLLEEAFASSQRMVYLIADLLNVSRLKTGKFIIEKSDVDLAQVVEDEIHQLKATARQRKLKLTYVKPSRFPVIQLDETKTRQVIMNFVDNAIYYTPAGGSIDVTIKATKSAVEFRVTDDGIGVPKDKQSKLFSKFYRASNAQKARPDGTGLGLYMAKKVIIAQGGSIIFNSKEGEGSTFGFRISR